MFKEPGRIRKAYHKASLGPSAWLQDIVALSRQLREMQRECAAATVAATTMLGAHAKHGEDADENLSISQLVDELVALLKACAIHQLKI